MLIILIIVLKDTNSGKKCCKNKTNTKSLLIRQKYELRKNKNANRYNTIRIGKNKKNFSLLPYNGAAEIPDLITDPTEFKNELKKKVNLLEQNQSIESYDLSQYNLEFNLSKQD